MQIFTSEKLLSWGEIDLPLLGLTEDWFGKKLHEPSTFTLAKDSEYLWFIGIFPPTAISSPSSNPGQFTPELWKYDVAELFLADPKNGEYLEFNITSNGAWWASKFSSPRIPSPKQPDFTANIRANYDSDISLRRIIGLQIPLNFLKMEIDFGDNTNANITFIRNTPSQLFLSASKLEGTEPNFHQPNLFQPVTFNPLPSY